MTIACRYQIITTVMSDDDSPQSKMLGVIGCLWRVLTCSRAMPDREVPVAAAMLCGAVPTHQSEPIDKWPAQIDQQQGASHVRGTWKTIDPRFCSCDTFELGAKAKKCC